MNYSEGIRAGRILIIEDQYKELIPTMKQDFTPVYRNGTRMYRYRNAVEPMAPVKVDNDSLFAPFVRDVDNITTILSRALEFERHEQILDTPVNFQLNVGEDDFDYMQGVMYTALANLDLRHIEFILEYQFADYWTVTLVDGIIDA